MKVSTKNKYIFANFKMNQNLDTCLDLCLKLDKDLPKDDKLIFAIFPAFPWLAAISNKPKNLFLGSQDVSHHDDGNYTAEVSTSMLTSLTCKFVLVGHSEVRQNFSQSDKIINLKMSKACQAGLIPVVCLGESLAVRNDGLEKEFIFKQLLASINTDYNNIIIAYEPIFAIGSGQAATIEQIIEMHSFIKESLDQLYQDKSHDIPILYGGSVNGGNAKSILSNDEVSGVLVGKASLDAKSFVEIGSALL